MHLLSSRDAGLLEPPERPQGSPASSSVWREDPAVSLPGCLPSLPTFPPPPVLCVDHGPPVACPVGDVAHLCGIRLFRGRRGSWGPRPVCVCSSQGTDPPQPHHQPYPRCRGCWVGAELWSLKEGLVDAGSEAALPALQAQTRQLSGCGGCGGPCPLLSTGSPARSPHWLL